MYIETNFQVTSKQIAMQMIAPRANLSKEQEYNFERWNFLLTVEVFDMVFKI